MIKWINELERRVEKSKMAIHTDHNLYQESSINFAQSNEVDVQNRFCYKIDLGIIPIREVDEIMTEWMKLRTADRFPDLLLMLAHPPSLALGARKLNHDDLLKPLEEFEAEGIHLTKSVRGGGLTYHWPGQLVCYPILKLAPDEQNLANYMYRLEETGLKTLKTLGVNAERRRDETAQIGLWIGNKKVASMGIYVSRWVTSFGFAVNLYGDTTPADYIRPCGLEGVKLTTVEKLTGKKPNRQIVSTILINNFINIFDRKIQKNFTVGHFIN